MSKLGIIAGGGRVSGLLLEHVIANELDYHVVTFKGQPKPDLKLEGGLVEQSKLIASYDSHHSELSLGAVAKVVAILKQNDVDKVVMIGALSKPSLFDLRPDVTAAKILASALTAHDNELLSKVYEFLENEGFKVVGVHEIMPELLVEAKNYSKAKPNKSQSEDIKLGLEVAKTLGKLDVGQAVIVKDGTIIGLEAVEGTSELVKRCAGLRGKKNKGGILVKAAKPQQNLRVDMPTIGIDTIKLLIENNYAGVAVSAGSSLFVDVEEAKLLADKGKIFICGLEN